MSEATLEVLRMIEEGTITAEEGERLLAAMAGGAGGEDQPKEVEAPPPPASPSPAGEESEPVPAGPPAGWQGLWIYPLVGGVTLLALMGYLTDLLVDGGTRLGWLACTIPLMIFGGLVAVLAWWSSSARWLHLRILEEGKQIKISLPLPLRLAAWLIRLARPWVPQLRDTAVDELILSLAETEPEEGILMVDVTEGEGERVQVYFG
jgi:hypothetical protein